MSQERYTQNSAFLRIENISLLEEILKFSPEKIQFNPPPLHDYQAEDLLELMEEIPEEEWQFYTFLACYDMMAGRSFVHDLRLGEPRETGGYGVVPHTRFNLAELGITKKEVVSQIPQGEYCPWESNFSHSKCCEKIEALKKAFGKDWKYKVIIENKDWSNQLILVATSKIANQHAVSLVIFGRGVVKWNGGHSFSWYEHYAENKLCNVYDHEYGRNRRGQKLCDGAFWQY